MIEAGAQQIIIDVPTLIYIIGGIAGTVVTIAFSVAVICLRFAFRSRIKMAKLEERVDNMKEDTRRDLNGLGCKIEKCLNIGKD